MKQIRLLLLILLSLIAPLCLASIDPQLFPVHKSHQANVDFWKKIFGEYSTTEAVIHDRHDLSIIYRIVKLVEKDTPNSKKINKKRIHSAQQDIIKTLTHLARGNRPASRKEKQIAAMFGKAATPDQYRQAAKQIRVQSGAKDRFAKGIIRSGRYLQEMQSIFKHYNLPPELTYLPHVESSFNPAAYSKYGAAGVWQFIRSTGKIYMRIGESLDERRDPILATHAAAKLLKKNYAELSSWPLAITAYNHGLAGMSRAKAKHGNYPAVFSNYRSRSFKFASKNFYSEFIAAYQVATNASQYFGTLKTDPPNRYHAVQLPGYLPIKTLKERLGLSSKTIYRKNPALKQAIFNGQKYIPKNYPLRLPASVNLARLEHLLPLSVFHSRQKPSLYHTVRKGETASSIARKHGVRLRDLVVANNLDRKATIYPRQKLRIPGKPATPRGYTFSKPRENAEEIAMSETDSQPAPSS